MHGDFRTSPSTKRPNILIRVRMVIPGGRSNFVVPGGKFHRLASADFYRARVCSAVGAFPCGWPPKMPSGADLQIVSQVA